MSTYEDLLGDDDFELVVGDDSTLGEFATEILGDEAKDDFELVVGLDPWLHKLNPSYWFKSSREKGLIDTEKKRGKELVSLAKRRKEQEQELSQARRTLATAQAARGAESESQAIEQELQDIQQSVSGAFVGAFVGAAEEGVKAAKKNKIACKVLADKAEKGEKLTPEEMAVLRRCLKMCSQLKALHRTLHAKATDSTTGYHTAEHLSPRAPSAKFLLEGEYATEILGGDDLMGGAKLAKKQWVEMSALAAAEPNKLGPYMKKKGIRLDSKQKTHLKNMTLITRRLMAKQLAKKAGVSGSFVGLSWKGFAKGLGKTAAIAALPVAALAYGTYKGTRWAGRKIFGGKKGSPQSQRAARIRAARARRLAALKRQQAANAETEAARQEALAQAAAAEAEASAADAETEASSAQQEAEEAQFTPGEGEGDGGEDEAPPAPGDDSQGAFVGSKSMFVDGAFVGVDAGAFVGAFVGAITDPKHKKIVKAAASNTPLGHKIRAGAATYKAAKAGHPKARMAVAKMQAKAAKGDPQAKRDLNAVKAGKIALQAKGKAQRQIAARGRADGRQNVFRKVEGAAAKKLVRVSHKRQLAKAAHVERRAAAGDRRAKAVVARVAAQAKKGNPKAQATVKAMQLSRRVRQAAKTPQEHRRLVQAHRVIKKARRGDRAAIKQVKIIQAAARAGQPNAKRAHARLQVAAAIEKTVTTGKVVAPPKKLSGPEKKLVVARRLKSLRSKVEAGTATREEGVEAARLAQKLGLKEQAAALALEARGLRPASQGIKNAAIVAASAQNGNPEAQKVISNALEEAEAGNPAGINSAGNLAAAQALHAVQNGAPMPPEVAEATGIVERARAGDPEAKRIVARAGEAAQAGDASGVKAAVALTAAGAVMAATVGRPLARKQWGEKAAEARSGKLQPAEVRNTQAEFAELYAKVQNGTATRAEAERARQLAMALNKPGLAAQISSLMPPIDSDVLTSLPDEPLPPINTPLELLKESLRALTFSTRDPLANYRDGVQSRGATAMIPPGVTPPAKKG